MGFRSTFTTQHYAIDWPEWFVEKYEATIMFPPGNCGPISSKIECKTYSTWVDLDKDIHRAIDWDSFPLDFVLVYLHECGGITRVQFDKAGVLYSEPDAWKETENITHDYCGACSDVYRTDR